MMDSPSSSFIGPRRRIYRPCKVNSRISQEQSAFSARASRHPLVNQFKVSRADSPELPFRTLPIGRGVEWESAPGSQPPGNAGVR
jgi:hypothetical protein